LVVEKLVVWMVVDNLGCVAVLVVFFIFRGLLKGTPNSLGLANHKSSNLYVLPESKRRVLPSPLSKASEQPVLGSVRVIDSEWLEQSRKFSGLSEDFLSRS
jgi:hypothetical protein